MHPRELDKTLKKAASSALNKWRIKGKAEDVAQSLWVWYLERPSAQGKFASSEYRLQLKLAKKTAYKILSKETLDGDRADGKFVYSLGSIREALRGESTNQYLVSVLPTAIKQLQSANPGQWEAVLSRYTDGLVPASGSAQQSRLRRAVKALTNEVNLIYLANRPAGRNAVDPDAIRRKHGHSDPTARVALELLEAGDEAIELHDGSTTTYREEFRNSSFDMESWTDRAQRPAIGQSIFDKAFNGVPHEEMYRAEIMPELFPHAKPMLIHNWPLQDLEMYVGGKYVN